MKILQTEIAALTNQLLSIELINDPNLVCPFHSKPEYHSHPEIEILYVIKGSGKRIVNGHTENYTTGDMVLLGPHVPHVWLSDTLANDRIKREPSSILTYLNTDKFDTLFREINEFSAIRQLIDKSKRGIQIIGATRDAIAEKLMQLHSLQGFSKIEGLFQILHQLSLSEEYRFTSPEHTPTRQLKVTDRLLPVFKYTSENLHSQVSLQEVAALARMSEHSFCRFFRSRMRKTFSQYMKDQRLKTACSLLVETDKPISEIGELCGYRSTSHFIQIFRSYNHQTPLSYRNQQRQHLYSPNI